MSQYTPTTGRILQIHRPAMDVEQQGCGITLTLDTMDQGIIHVHLDGATYVLHNQRLNVGDFITCFYSLSDPVPLIYPPSYRAAVIAHTPSGNYAALDVFTQDFYNRFLVNSDHTLILHLSGRTVRTLPNGQPFDGSLSGKLLLVLYGATTRSIPAQTTPEEIVVFCAGTPLFMQ